MQEGPVLRVGDSKDELEQAKVNRTTFRHGGVTGDELSGAKRVAPVNLMQEGLALSLRDAKDELERAKVNRTIFCYGVIYETLLEKKFDFATLPGNRDSRTPASGENIATCS